MLATTRRPRRATTMNLSRAVTWLAGRRRPRPDERDDHEDQDEHDRQPEERALQAPPAAVGGGLATEGGRKARAAGLQEDRARDRDGDDDLTDLKWIHEVLSLPEHLGGAPPPTLQRGTYTHSVASCRSSR